MRLLGMGRLGKSIRPLAFVSAVNAMKHDMERESKTQTADALGLKRSTSQLYLYLPSCHSLYLLRQQPFSYR